MRKTDVEVQVTIPAGGYWLGDPCYTIKDEDWMPWLEACNYTEEVNLLGKIPGTDFHAAGFGTAFGDGVFPYQKVSTGKQEAQLAVDAGMIGFVPKEYGGEAQPLVVEVYFDRPVTVTCRDGNLSWRTSLGEYQVITDGSEEIEEDEEEEDE